jgi:hypothetical protein
VFRYSVAKPGQAKQVRQEIAGLPAGPCMGVRYASQFGFTGASSWLDYGAPASCRDGISATLRELYTKCAQFTTQVRASACMHACMLRSLRADS